VTGDPRQRHFAASGAVNQSENRTVLLMLT
jgi:hypothetical protein